MMWDSDGRWAMHHNDGAGWLMVLLMLVFVIAVVVIAVALLRGTVATPTTATAVPDARASRPREILQERFARGEIDEQDYRTRMRALDESSG
jgi:putative membrane protein